MPTLHASGLTHSFGANIVFSGVSFSLPPRERLALIGRNGAGKTTLLRVLAGEAEPDAGSVSYPKGYRIALHDQRPPLTRGLTLGGYVGEGLTDVRAAEARLTELEARMAGGDGSPATLEAYDLAQRQLEAAGGYAWRARLGSILRGLGFADEQFDRPLESFSGGELTRASLARALASNPDLLLLDEPTNHLDLRSLEWLEDELANLDCAVLLVSHDRWFLERVSTGVLELERGRAKLYSMTYSAYRRERAEALANQAEAFERQKEEIERLERFVAKFKAGTRSRQAQSRQKEIDRIERVEAPRKDKALAFGFPRTDRSTRVVHRGRGPRRARSPSARSSPARTFHVEAGQRVALIGPNGAGKTTLVETLLGKRPAAAGPGQDRPQRRARLLLAARVRAARLDDRDRGDALELEQEGHLEPGAQHPRPLPVHAGDGRAPRRGALRRRAPPARARGAVRLGPQPAGARRAHEPPRRREPRGARGRARRLRRHDPPDLARSRADRRGRDPHGEHRGAARRAATRRLQRLPRRHGAEARAAAARRRRRGPPLAKPKGAAPAPAPAGDKRRARRIREIERRIDEIETRQAGLEALLLEPEVLADHERLAETGRALADSQQELAWQMKEWEALHSS